MNISDRLHPTNVKTQIVSEYENRGNTDSARFLRWFLENIFRLDAQDADDSCVDKSQDKGVDGIYVNDTEETIYLLQCKVSTKKKGSLGDTDLKEFSGTLEQFSDSSKVEDILTGNANAELKAAITRNKVIDKLNAGYAVQGVFCTNLVRNQDAIEVLPKLKQIALYDSDTISEEFVEVDSASGVKGKFRFSASDTDLIEYNTKDGISSRIFLAKASDLVKLKGIANQKLFEKNVRLSLGKTKINKSLVESISDKKNHEKFPLYHNGITLLCSSIKEEANGDVTVTDYVVVNGAQSITSLYGSKNKITDDLRILVKVIGALENDNLTDQITFRSNNQNAIKARDLRSNHAIQTRLKKEVETASNSKLFYEIKRGENPGGKEVLSNEDAGLFLLAMDLGEPWSCHQKYKIMDESHAKIFGRPNVNGEKIVLFRKCFSEAIGALTEIDDQAFAGYNLTKYFLAYAVAEIMKTSDEARPYMIAPEGIVQGGQADKFAKLFGEIAETTALDLNVIYAEEKEEKPDFDFKSELKSPNWCRTQMTALKTAFLKDVKRKKAPAIDTQVSKF